MASPEDNVRKVIEMKQNPNPLYVVVGTVVVLAAMFVLYIVFLKPDLSGSWESVDGKLELRYSKFTDELNVVGIPGLNVPLRVDGHHASHSTKTHSWTLAFSNHFDSLKVYEEKLESDGGKGEKFGHLKSLVYFRVKSVSA